MVECVNQMRNQHVILIKLTFVHGLQATVIEEIEKYPELKGLIRIVERGVDYLYFDFIPAIIEDTADDSDDTAGGTDETNGNNDENSASIVDSFLETLQTLKKLRSITNIYLVQKGEKFHPLYINSHKSILGTMIELVIHASEIKTFKTFKLRCAGSDSAEVILIRKYIADTFKLTESEEADLDTYIHKPGELWEVGVRVTSRPLSVRDYKVENIRGGINPAIAYTINTFALAKFTADQKNLQSNEVASHVSAPATSEPFSYLNICSGSATLLTEAGIEICKAYTSTEKDSSKDIYTNIPSHIKLLGFDIDNKTNSLAIQNIKKAGFIRSIQIKTADLLEKPDFGTFDAIVSDLPFGMQVAKGSDLDKLYKAFVEYAETHLRPEGVLVVYTTEVDTFGQALRGSKFGIEKTITLQITTAVNSHIHPKIFVCKFK